MKTSLSLAVLIVLTPSAMGQDKISGCLLTPGGILYNVRIETLRLLPADLRTPL